MPENMTNLDWTEYATPAPEWQEYVAEHPEEGGTATLPDDKSMPELQSETNETRRQHSEREFEEAGLKDRVTIEEEDIRNGKKGDDSEQEEDDKLTATIYTRNPREDDLELDRVPGVVYYHGGGYVFGTPDTERYICSLLAERLRVVVVHVSYRQPPRHRHPAAHEDGKDGFEWVVENADRLGIDPKQIVIVGLSAGAGIAASTALRVCNEDAERREVEGETGRHPAKRRRTDDGDGEGGEQRKRGSSDEKADPLPEGKVVDRSAPMAGREKPKSRIKGLLLVVPWLMQESAFPYHLYRSREQASRVQCANAPVMSQSVYERLTDELGATDDSDPLLNVPLASDEELARLPRTAMMVAGMDMFRDDGLILAEKLHSLRVPRRVHMFKGMPHGFRDYDGLWASKRFDELVLLLINWALERTMSSMVTGLHVEQRPDHAEIKSQDQSRFVTRDARTGMPVSSARGAKTGV